MFLILGLAAAAQGLCLDPDESTSWGMRAIEAGETCKKHGAAKPPPPVYTKVEEPGVFNELWTNTREAFEADRIYYRTAHQLFFWGTTQRLIGMCSVSLPPKSVQDIRRFFDADGAVQKSKMAEFLLAKGNEQFEQGAREGRMEPPRKEVCAKVLIDWRKELLELDR